MNKALLIVATKAIRRFNERLTMSQSPEGSSYSCNLVVWYRLVSNPGVSITRRLFLSLQHYRSCVRRPHCTTSLNHPKALLISATIYQRRSLDSGNRRSQSPEGSSYLCNFAFFFIPNMVSSCVVSITRRLFLSLQQNGHSYPAYGYSSSLNHPKALLISATQQTGCASSIEIGCLNHPKALLISATVRILRLPHAQVMTSQSPEGSSYLCNCQGPQDTQVFRKVSITRRLFLSLQLIPLCQLRQRMYFSLNHPKALLISATGK